VFHPNSGSFFKLKSDDETNIWRYLDFTKFAAMLDSSALFFSRLDRFDDPYEGATTQLTLEKRNRRLEELVANHPQHDRERYRNRMLIHYKNRFHIRKRIAANCWHKNEHESEAMWKLYVPSGEGVAIKTTIKGLKDALEPHPELFYIADIEYQDYSTFTFTDNSVLDQSLVKRASFSHESELRTFLVKDLGDLNKHEELHDSPIDYGINVKIDVNTLVQELYICPSAPSWFASLVENTAKKYGMTSEVKHSLLDQLPVF